MFSRARNLPVSGADLGWLDVSRGVDFDGFGSRIICPSVPAAQVSDRLYLTGAGLNVPSDATILGVEVSFSMRRDGTDPELDRVNIMTGSFPAPSRVSINRAPSRSISSLSDSFRHFAFGGSSDTWGLRLTPEEINSDGFGTMISVQYAAACDAPNTQFVIDAAEVRVRCEEPCD